MALTLNRVPNFDDVWGRTQVRVFDVVCDNSYPLTNGYVINAQDVGLKAFYGAEILGGNKAGGAVLTGFDLALVSTGQFLPTSVAMRLFYPTGGATAPATLTAPVAALTLGAITVTNGAITAGANTVGGTATATPAAGGTTVTSTSAQPAIPVALGSVTVTSANPTQATTTASIAASTSALTAGIGKEVGNATDVSSLIYRVRFLGI